MLVSRSEKGFTLIELVAAIAIISILSVIGIFVIRNVREKAMDAKRTLDIKAISRAYEVSYSNGLYRVLNNTDFVAGEIPYDPYGKEYSGLITQNSCYYKVCSPLHANPNTTCSENSNDCICLKAARVDDQCAAAAQATNPSKRVFVTQQLYGADMGSGPHGVAGANLNCQNAAVQGSLDGTWKAWISTNSIDARDNITTHNNGPYELVDLQKTKIADNWADLIDGTIDNTLSVTQYGQQLDWEGAAYTNTNSAGQKAALNTDCNGFTTISTAQLNYGRPTKSNANWTQEAPISQCDHIKALYCFEQ